MRTQCLDRRIAERAQLEAEIAVWERRRNANQETIQWMFTCEMARQNWLTPTRNFAQNPMLCRWPLEPVKITVPRY